MERRTAIKRRSSFDKTNRICELETAKAFFRQLQATLAEKRGVNVAPSGISVRRRRNRQRRPINGVPGSRLVNLTAWSDMRAHRSTALLRFTYARLRIMKSEEIMASIVVCAEPGGWQQASRFAQKMLGDAELKSFEDLRRRAPVQPSARVLDQHGLSSSPLASTDFEARQSQCGDLLCKSSCAGGSCTAW